MKTKVKAATKFNQAATCEQGVCVKEPKQIKIYSSENNLLMYLGYIETSSWPLLSPSDQELHYLAHTANL